MDYIHYKTKYNFYFAYKKYIFQIQLYVYKQVESTVHRYWIACLLYFWQGENKIPYKRLFLFKSAATRWFSVLTSISQCVFKSLNRDGASMETLIAHTEYSSPFEWHPFYILKKSSNRANLCPCPTSHLLVSRAVRHESAGLS